MLAERGVVKRARAVRLALVFLLCTGAAAPGVYQIISAVDLRGTDLGGPWGDAYQYVRMYQGASLETVPKPLRWRILTPYLARLVPAPPGAANRLYAITPDTVVKFKFGVVNLLGLGGAGLFTFLLCEALGFAAPACLLGSLLFLGGHAVVNYAGGPMTDAASYFFLCAAIVCVLRGWRRGLLVTVLVGMLAKETTAYVLVPILFLPAPASARIRQALLCLPGLLLYAGFRWTVHVTRGWDYRIGNPLVNVWDRLHSARRIAFTGIEGWLGFGMVWIFAAWGFSILARRGSWRSPILRLSALVPVAVALPILLDANVARMSYLAFPAMVPLALVAIDRLFPAGGRGLEPRGAEESASS